MRIQVTQVVKQEPSDDYDFPGDDGQVYLTRHTWTCHGDIDGMDTQNIALVYDGKQGSPPAIDLTNTPDWEGDVTRKTDNRGNVYYKMIKPKDSRFGGSSRGGSRPPQRSSAPQGGSTQGSRTQTPSASLYTAEDCKNELYISVKSSIDVAVKAGATGITCDIGKLAGVYGMICKDRGVVLVEPKAASKPAAPATPTYNTERTDNEPNAEEQAIIDKAQAELDGPVDDSGDLPF